VVTTLDPAHVVTPDLSKTYAVAEFMLNLLDIKEAPRRQDVEAYVEANFACSGGGYRIPVHQDFLQIRARAGDGVWNQVLPGQKPELTHPAFTIFSG
jgi:hypothetical protein